MRFRSSLADTILVLLIGITVTSTLIVGALWISQEYFRFNSDSAAVKEGFYESQKTQIKDEINKTIDYMNYKRSQTEERLKFTIKERAYDATAIAANLYNEYKNSRALPEIKKMVKDALRPIRFNNGRGYYFATNLEGIEQLFADRPDLENKNLIDMKDPLGKYVIRDMIKIAKEQNEGFYRYNWTKPNSEGRNFPKIAFIKYFKPFDWFIGTGEYLDDVEEDIKKEVLDRINRIKYGNNGYIFTLDYNGILISHLDKKLVGKSLYDVVPVDEKEKMQDAMKSVMNGKSRFVKYIAPIKPETGQPGLKLSYFKGIPEWKWVIGTGEYMDEIENVINLKKHALTRHIRSSIFNTVLILLILFVVIFFVSRRVSRRARSSFDVFSFFFDKAVSESLKIDIESLHFSEFKILAEAANHMVGERERIEKDLKKSMENLAKSQAIAHLGSWEWDIVTNDMFWSEEGFRLLGEESNNKIIDFDYYMSRIYPEDRESVTQAIQETLEGKKDYNIEYRIVRADGVVRIHHSQAELVRDENGKPFRMIGIAWDITEFKMAQEKTARLTMAIEQAAEFIVITDAEGTIQYVNPAFERITGYSRNEVIGENPRFLKSGKQGPEFYKELWDTITGGKVWRGRFVNKKKNGSFYIEDAAISPIRGLSGVITNFVAVKHDVTREVEMEKQLLQSQKMEAIGTLAGGIAHDFNNILGAIIGYSEIALYDIDKDSSAAENIRQVLSAGNRAKDLVKQILSFSRINEDKRIPIRLSHVIQEAVTIIRASLPSFIRIRQDLETVDDHIMGDHTRLQQLLINLCANAAHAMEENESGGALDIKLDRVIVDDQNISEFPQLNPGPHVKLSIIDSGKGMTPEVMERIFEPYFTTKEHGKGTGLGLALVHTVVRNHAGLIKVESELGMGSAFHVLFPTIESSVDEVQDEADWIPIAGTFESILFVDDEIMLTDMGKKMLERLGYYVTASNDSLKALEIFRENPNAFHLVITDMTMPNLPGDKLAVEIKKIRPDIPLILCTGYSEYLTVKRAAAAGFDFFLMKPLSLHQISNTVRAALDKGGTVSPPV